MAQSNYNYPHQASYSYNASLSSIVSAEGLQSCSEQVFNPYNYNSHLGYTWNHPGFVWHHQQQNPVVPPYSSNLYCENYVSSNTKILEDVDPSANILKLPKLTNSQEQWLNHVKQCKMDQIFVNQFIHSKLAGVHRDTQNSIHGNTVSEPRDDSDTSQLNAAKNIRRKNKREWIQRKKKRLVEEEKEVLERRAEKHRAIDERLEVLRQQDCKKKLNNASQQEAGRLLKDIMSKQSETQELLQLLKSVQELRTIRARSLESTYGLNASTDDTTHFDNVTNRLEIVVKKKAMDYEKDLAVQPIENVTQPHDEVKKQWEKYYIRNNVPMT